MGRPPDIDRAFKKLTAEARTRATDRRGGFSAIAHAEFWASNAYSHGPHLRALCWEQFGVALLRLAAIAGGGSGAVSVGPQTLRMVGTGVGDLPVDTDELLAAAESVLSRAQRLAATLGDDLLTRGLASDLAVLASYREGLTGAEADAEEFAVFESPMPVFIELEHDAPPPVVEPSAVWANALRSIAVTAHVTEIVDRAARASGVEGPDPRRDAENNLVIDAYLRAREAVAARHDGDSLDSGDR